MLIHCDLAVGSYTFFMQENTCVANSDVMPADVIADLSFSLSFPGVNCKLCYTITIYQSNLQSQYRINFFYIHHIEYEQLL